MSVICHTTTRDRDPPQRLEIRAEPTFDTTKFGSCHVCVFRPQVLRVARSKYRSMGIDFRALGDNHRGVSKWLIAALSSRMVIVPSSSPSTITRIICRQVRVR